MTQTVLAVVPPRNDPEQPGLEGIVGAGLQGIEDRRRAGRAGPGGTAAPARDHKTRPRRRQVRAPQPTVVHQRPSRRSLLGRWSGKWQPRRPPLEGFNPPLHFDPGTRRWSGTRFPGHGDRPSQNPKNDKTGQRFSQTEHGEIQSGRVRSRGVRDLRTEGANHGPCDLASRPCLSSGTCSVFPWCLRALVVNQSLPTAEKS